MNRRRPSRFWRPMLALAIALIPLLATAGDWPMYLQNIQRTAANGGETTISIANAPQLVKLWSYQAGNIVTSAPTVVSGTVFAGSSDGYEYALDATTGALKWRTFLGLTTSSVPSCAIGGNPFAGVSSSATVISGTVYVGGGDANWYALDASTGAVLWSVYIGDTNPITGGNYNWSSPLIYNGYAYIGAASFCDQPLVQGRLIQVSVSTHQVVNTFDVVPSGQTGGSIWTSPSLDPSTNTLYVATGNGSSDYEPPTAQPYTVSMIALDATTLAVKGAWQVPVSQQSLDSDWTTTPILFTDTTGRPLLAAINKNGSVYAFDRGNISAGPVWQRNVAVAGPDPYQGDSSVSSGAFANNTLYIGGNNTIINGQPTTGFVRALDPATGNFLWEHSAPGTVFPALVYANGLIVDGAGGYLEVLNAATGDRLFSYQIGASLTGVVYGVSIANGIIYADAGDNNVYAFGLPSPPPPPTATPPPDPACPDSWICQDIGAPSVPGSETSAGGVYTITAGGNGIGGTVDQFRLVARNVARNLQFAAQVVTQTADGGVAEAGLMVRQSTDVAAPYYGVFLSPGTLVVSARQTSGAASIPLVTLPNSGALHYLEILRVGDVFSAAASSDGQHYTSIQGSQVAEVLPSSGLAGLAVSAQNSAMTSTAVFSGVAMSGLGPPPALPTPLPDLSCPHSWQCADIGGFLPVGSETVTGTTWTVRGAGRAITLAADQLHYVWKLLPGDGNISARVITQTGTDSIAAAGLMIRGNVSAAAPYYAVDFTPGYGIVVVQRPTTGAFARAAVPMTATTPVYIAIARTGTIFAAAFSLNGVSWTLLPNSTFSLHNLRGPVLIGLTVSSNTVNVLNAATFSSIHLQYVPTATPTPTATCTPSPTVTPTPPG